MQVVTKFHWHSELVGKQMRELNCIPGSVHSHVLCDMTPCARVLDDEDCAARHQLLAKDTSHCPDIYAFTNTALKTSDVTDDIYHSRWSSTPDIVDAQSCACPQLRTAGWRQAILVAERSFDCCDRGFEYRWGYRYLYLSLVFVVYCRVRPLRRADHSSREVLSSVCLTVCDQVQQ